MRERFMAAFLVLIATSWVLGLMHSSLAFAGPLAAGYVFVRFRAGVTRRNIASGAGSAAAAVALMVLPIAVFSWVLITATSAPGEAHNLLEALVDVNGNTGRALAAGVFVLVSTLVAAIGGGLAAWLHRRQLDREYWVVEKE